MKRLLGRPLRLAAVAYLLSLLAVVVALRWGGERWWVTTIALYVPRVAFALPLPLLVILLVAARAWRWLAVPALAALVLLFPLMGLHLRGGRAPTRGAARLTVLQLNMGFGHGGIEPVLALVRDTRPDVVALEAVGGNFWSLQAGLPGYVFFRDGELALGSRLPLDEFTPDPTLAGGGAGHPAMYIRARATTPAGPVRVYAVHPTSPHPSFDKIRESGHPAELFTSELFEQEARRAMAETTVLRLAQLGAVADDARRSSDPVLIVGDTNLPELSWAFAGLFSAYHDAFAETGRGFGYTYPADRGPWMRIDRILAGDGLRVLAASAPPRRIYKHLPLMAEIEILPTAAPR